MLILVKKENLIKRTQSNEYMHSAFLIRFDKLCLCLSSLIFSSKFMLDNFS